MKVIEHLNKAQSAPIFSIEILPPNKGQRAQEILKNLEPIIQYNPAFIDVTYHREEFYYQELPNGFIQKIVTKKRPATVGLCAAIQTAYNIDTVPHVLCGGFTKEDTENFLIDLDFLGINNIVALRGDPIRSEINFTAERHGNRYASELVTQVNNLKRGKYQHTTEGLAPLDFCVGVAGYPEKHIEAPNTQLDLKYLKQKVENGADYIITQMFFDNQKFYDFVAQCRSIGINVPIVPGLKPITNIKQLTAIAHRFSVDIPSELVDQLLAAENQQERFNIGVKYCIEQSKDLLNNGIPYIHYYSMSRFDAIIPIVKEVFHKESAFV